MVGKSMSSIRTRMFLVVALAVGLVITAPSLPESSSAYAAAARVPSAPVVSSISTSVSQTLSVAYRLGAANGSPITSVEYSIDGGTTWSETSSSPILLSGLANGTSYTVQMRSKNAVGTSAVSSRSAKPVATKNTTTFTTPISMTFGDGDQSLIATSTGGDVVFNSLTSPICSVVDGAIHPLTAGTCRIQATNVGDAVFAAAKAVTKTVVIKKAPLSIFFPAVSAVALGGSDRDLGITAIAGTNVVTSATTSVCSIVNGLLHPIKVGTCIVRVSNSGSASYSSAPGVSRSFPVTVAQTQTPTPTTSASPTPTSSATPTSTPSVTATTSATPTPSVTPSAIPTSIIPDVVNIRLSSDDKKYMTDKSYWWTNETQSYSWVKMVAAGDVLTLRYSVTNSSGSALTNALVTLNIANNSIASFSGSLTARTNASGVATFTLTSTTSEAAAEPRPVGPSMMWYWDDTRSVSPEVKFDITPTVGAATEHIDRVWTHTVKSASASITKTLLWSDEFSGTANAAPSSSVWNAETGNGCPGNCGWGNKELQYYTAAANKQDGSSEGILNLTATRLPATTTYGCPYGAGGKCSFTSGRLTTQNKVNFSYGYLEAKIKVPAGNGTWPAFWALGNNITSVSWPACGELDILEAFGRYPRVAQGTAHMANAAGGDSYYYGQVQMPENLSAGYHTFGILWKPTSLQWYIDDNLYYTLNKSSVGSDSWAFGPRSDGSAPKFFAIMNLALGGNLGGVIDASLNSAVMSVDWVRYYSVDGYGAVTTS